ncbi:unnamed protein product [Schistocephalus solidus]|uniref:C2H2-type domain-containing protein n=1 Tax=Schistocephalus solidus TaxID=70667 RepID=A0A183TQ46_SCHSO|nr:unnamed protein product [Schistocephalus solidus]
MTCRCTSYFARVVLAADNRTILAPGDIHQLGDLGGPRPEPTGLEKDSENRGSNLRSQQDRFAKIKRAARKSPAPRTYTANAQALPTCPHWQRIFRARIGLVGHLRTQCSNNKTIPTSTSNSADPPFASSTLTPGINSITPTIIETTSQYSSPVTSTTISDGYSLRNCPHCDRTLTSRIGMIGHLRIHRTETGEPVPGAQTHSREHCLHCPHCSRTFSHRMDLFSHMRIHDSGIHRYVNNTDTPCTPSAPAILTTNDIPQPLPKAPAHTPPATSTHASAWSDTCESIAQRLVNQCLGLRPTVDALASTALTAPAPLHNTWAY